MILHLEAVDFTASGTRPNVSAGGVLYLSIGDTYFPEENWYDLVSVDFESWLPNLISFSQNHTDTCVLSFMDGPCSIKLERCQCGSVHVKCIWESKVALESEIDFYQFLSSVVKCIGKYNFELHNQNFQSQFQSECAVLNDILKRIRSFKE